VSAATDRFLALTGARLPLVQAPMANFAGSALAIAALKAGAVGSLACAVLSPDQVAAEVAATRAAAAGPINLNFFCHRLGPQPDESAWRLPLSIRRKESPRRRSPRYCASRSTRRWPI
jgi:nitronate monooxygenase